MHERPGPQYNRGNDPTTGICILKNGTQKKWYLRFWNIFFFILRWRAEFPVVFSGVSRGGGGRVRCPLSFRPKRGPKVREKFFFETGPPLYLRIWMTQPPPTRPPPPIWRSGSATGLIESEGEMEALSESCQTSVVGACSSNLRTYLSWSLKNVPLSGGASVYRPLQGVAPGFQTKTAQNLYPFPGWENPSLQKAHRKNKPVPIRLVKWS